MPVISQNTANIHGPGLDPINIILPARYFSIVLNENSNKSSAIEFKARGHAFNSGDTKRPCRVWHNILNRRDGSFIARYKLYEECINFQLEVTQDGVHLGGSPYKFGKAVIKHEMCNCPRDFNHWLVKNQCGDVPEQVQMDLQYFRNINWAKLRSQVIERFNKPEAISICHYVISDNRLYRKCYGEHVGFKMFTDNILLFLLRRIKFPDMEFMTNLGDWPLVREKAVPVFSWCGSEDTYDIVMPTYDITQATLENMGRVTLDMLSVQGNTPKQWDEREAKVFWRGRDSHPSRLKLIDIAKEHPELFNVSMTNFFFYKNKQEKYGPKSPHVSFFKFFDYKFQIGIDGTVAAYRFPYLLAGGSLIFKQTSKYYEHFYHLLKPEEHYIPIEEDLSDLKSKVDWAVNHDDESQQMAKNAQEFANNHLLPNDIICYHAHLFNEYSKLLSGDNSLLDGMEEVPQPTESQTCQCLPDQLKDEL